MSLYVGGIPYLVFAGAMLLALWKRGFREYRLIALVSPIAFLLFFVLCIIVFAAIVGQVGPIIVFNSELVGMYGAIIVLGYTYVLIAFTGYKALRRLGWIKLDYTATPPNTMLQTDR